MDENVKLPFLKPGLLYGAIMGLIGILYSVLMYVMNIMFEGWVGLVSFAITIIVLVFLLRAYRNEYLGGFAGYGRLVLMSLMIGLVSAIIGVLFNYLLYTVIDPDLLQKSLTITESKLLDNPRVPENMIDSIMERTERNMQPGRMAVTGLIAGTLFPGVIGLIAAIFLKKEAENPMNDVA